MLIGLVTVCVETDIIREKTEGRKEGTRKRRKGRKQPQDDLQENKRYLNLEKRSPRSHFILSWLWKGLWISSKRYQAIN
jgi:hypothetical protein